MLDTVLLKRQAEIDRKENRRSRFSLLDHPLIGIVFPFAVIICWELLVRAGIVGGRLMPPPSRILATVQELALSGDLLIHC